MELSYTRIVNFLMLEIRPKLCSSPVFIRKKLFSSALGIHSELAHGKCAQKSVEISQEFGLVLFFVSMRPHVTFQF